MRIYLIAALAAVAAALACLSARSPEIVFERHTLDLGVSETCAIADFNNDGRPDIFSGDAWYENPTWKRHEVRHLKEYGTYLASLSDNALDVDGDGNIDIVSSGWHSGKIWWSRNPGKAGGIWEDHTIDEGSAVEFSFLVDLDNDGKARELLPQFGNGALPTAWYEAVHGEFRKHVVSPRSYGHGIGAGDVNGDGRNDIITPQGLAGSAARSAHSAIGPFIPNSTSARPASSTSSTSMKTASPISSPPTPTTTASSGWSSAPTTPGSST